MIEIPGVARPGPPPHGRSRAYPDILKTIAEVFVQTVAHGVLPVEGARLLVEVLLKISLFRDANAGGRPHVGDVKLLPAIIVKIQPGNAHAGAYILHASFA